ncbi:MAG: ice-binding family protein [Candidatus Saccharimonadales bacterium]
MKKFHRHSIITVLVVASVLGLAGVVMTSPAGYAAHPTVNLRTAEPFAILSGTGITNVPTSTITGNIGVHPTTGASMTGISCSEVIGTIYDIDGTFAGACEVVDPALLNTAKIDLVTAYDDAAGRTPVTTVPTELGGTTKTDGVYNSASTTFEITAGAGPLVLDGQGNPNAVFIFLMNSGATGLTVGSGSTVSLINGAQACNVFWKLNTATIDTTAVFKGNILALTSITVANGANIEGRLLARNGNVTLISDTITRAVCAATTTPGLPNAGIGSEDKSGISWNIIIPAGIVVALFSLHLARKKQAV